MNRTFIPLDISNILPLVKLAEDVQKTRKPRLLKRDNQPVAMLVPVATPLKIRKREVSKAKYEAFKAAAGSWSDIDVEQFKADIYASRKISTSPPVEL